MGNSVKVVTGPKTRWSYVHVFEPHSFADETPAWSLSLIIPKDDKETVTKIQKAIKDCYESNKDMFKNKSGGYIELKDLDIPLHDGDKERSDDAAYKGCYYLNAKNRKQAPQIVDKACNPILDRDEVYSGCYGRASIRFFAYNKGVNKGISCGLNNLQKIADGDRLDGGTTAAMDFAEYTDEADNDIGFDLLS